MNMDLDHYKDHSAELCNKCGLSCYLSDYGRQSWTQRCALDRDYKGQCASDHDNRGRCAPDRDYMERVHIGSHPTIGAAPPRLRLQNGILIPDQPKSGSLPSVTAQIGWDTWIPWLRANRLVLIVLAMLALTVILPFVWCHQIGPQQEGTLPEKYKKHSTEYVEADEKLGRIVRSLQAVQVQNHNKLQRQVSLTENITKTKYPWLVQNNVLPNYFLREDSAIPPTSAYRNSPVIFLHHHRAAGSALSACLQNISTERNLGAVPDWTSNSRALWDSRKKASDQRIHTGQYSFGICETISPRRRREPCSYFVFLRDPMERAVSSYHFCQEVGLRSDQEMCRVVDANDVSLRDWILLQGSLTFQQFLYNATWCDDPTPQPGSYALDGTDVRVAPSKHWPCWLKQRVHVDSLSQTETTHLLDYILRNMESWFSMIGLTSDMDKSLAMLDKVYNLPFSKCSGLKQTSSNDKQFNPHDNRSNRKKHKDGYYDDNDPHYLKYDYFVRKALHADYEIYKQAQNIYRRQKQMVFNSL